MDPQSVPPESLPGTIMDGHIHTVRGAADSQLQPGELFEEARRIGLTGVNLSEHDRVWERYDWNNYNEEMREAGIYLQRGMEVSTDLGHIVVFGIDQYYQGIRSAKQLRKICDEIGAFMSVAHPFRHFFDPVTFRRRGEEPFSMTPDEAAHKMEVFSLVHGIEVGNGGNTRRENLFALEVARILDKPMTGGSDAHSTSGIGSYATVFPEPLTCSEQTIQLLHDGATVCYDGLNRGEFGPFGPCADDDAL